MIYTMNNAFPRLVIVGGLTTGS